MSCVKHLPEQIKPLLVRLLRTDQDGEVIGCRDAIIRKLQAAGFDAHDLIECIEPAPAPAQSDIWWRPPPAPQSECVCHRVVEFEIVKYDRAGKQFIVHLLDCTGQVFGRGRICRSGIHYTLYCEHEHYIRHVKKDRVDAAWREFKRREREDTS
jgi:hypothetical protein